MNEKRPKLALVIGSGGLKCAAAIGVMQVLEEEGIKVDMVVGGSGGAVFGAETTFADTKIPFYCVATDFHTRGAVVLSQGGLAKAVRISSGIPIIFKPLEWDRKLLIDGGLSNPLPIDVAIQEGAEIITIVPGFKEGISISDVNSVPFIIEQGKKETLRHLAYLKRTLNPASAS